MAIKRTDDPKYKDPHRYTAYLREEFEMDRSLKKGVAVRAALSLAPATLMAFFLALPNTLENPRPAADPDLYTGVFNQTQNYSFFTDDRYFYGKANEGQLLIRNDEGYALYTVSEHDDNKLMLVADREEAMTMIGTVSGNIQQQLDELTALAPQLSPFDKEDTQIITCDYISGPFNYLGGVERFQANRECDQVGGMPLERMETYSENLAFWQEATAELTQNSVTYGPDADAIIPAEFESKWMSFFKDLALLSLGGGTILSGMSVVGAGNRRRKHLKNRM